MKLGDRRLADLVIQQIEKRMAGKLGSYSRLTHRYGVVVDTSVSVRASCSVYLGSQTAYASPNFKNLSGETLAAGDQVLVVIDPLGDRYVDKKTG